MKKIILISFIILSSISSKAQFAFPDSAVIWSNVDWCYAMPAPYICGTASYCAPGTDTIIGTNSYKHLYGCIGSSSYIGAFRDSSNVIFFIPKDSTSEFTLYDFSRSIGDTIYNVLHGGEVAPMMILDQISTDQQGRELFYWNDGNFNLDAAWIEGIGCEHGFLQTMWSNVGGVAQTMNCVSLGDSTIYPDFGFGACPTDLSVDNNKTMKFTIYPNPSSEFISFSTPLKSVEIHNTLGAIVYKSDESISSVNIKDLRNGTYILTGSTTDNLQIQQRILIQH